MSGTTLYETDLKASIDHVLQRGGRVFTDTLAFAAAGTGTSRAVISSTYPVPSIAKELLAIRPILTASTGAAAGNVCFAMFDIIGTNFGYQPVQILGPVSGPVLSAGTMSPSPMEWWTVRARANAGDTFSWGVTPLIANANNMRASFELLWATEVSGDAPIASQVSAVGTYTAAGATAATSITPTNAKYLYETASAIVSGAVTVSQPANASVNIQCSGFDPIQAWNYAVEPSGAVISTTGQANVTQVVRNIPWGLKFTIPNAVVNYIVTADQLVTNAATFAHCLRYIKGQ